MKTSSLKESSSIAQKAFYVALSIGVIEVFTGFFSSSIALVADGLHSIAMAMVFLIVTIGLRLSGRAPDGTFHFGYYRFETLGSLLAAFFLTVFSGIIIYESYFLWLEPRTVTNMNVALIVAIGSTIVAIITTAQIEKASRRFASTSLKTSALNGAMDAASSIAVSVSIILNGYFDILHADAIAGIIIAVAVFVVAYSIIQESSLVLVDACKCGDVIKAISDVAKSVKEIKEVHSIRMRKLGPYIIGDMHIVVPGDMLVKEADFISTQVEERIKQQFGDVKEFKIRIESDEAHDKHAREIVIEKNSSP